MFSLTITAKEMLTKGRDFLSSRDLSKGAYQMYEANGMGTSIVACCTIGAVRAGCDYFPLISEIETILPRAMGFGDDTELYQWNDHEDRTKAEVLARFDEAIARLTT